MGVIPSVLGVKPVELRLRRLQKKLDIVAAITPKLMAAILADACPRCQMPHYEPERAAIRRFIDDEAWFDVALALVRLEVPNWTLRALIREDGEWSCILARRWPMDWLDLVEQHEALPVAVLKAFLAAQLCEQARKPEDPGPPPVRSNAAATGDPVVCDNFC